MTALKRLFDISPNDIHCKVCFGNVRDEIIKLSKEGSMTLLSSDRKTEYHHPSAGVKRGIYSALRHDSGISRSLITSPHPKGGGEYYSSLNHSLFSWRISWTDSLISCRCSVIAFSTPSASRFSSALKISWCWRSSISGGETWSRLM